MSLIHPIAKRLLEPLKKRFCRPTKESFPILTPASLIWQEEELDLLLHFEKSKSRCFVKEQTHGSLHQTLLLGIDLSANRLLLDNCYPPLQATNDDYELELISPQGLLNLKFRVIDILAPTREPSLLVELRSKGWAKQTKLVPTIKPNPDERPQARILIPLHGPVIGVITELSKDGFLLQQTTRHRLKKLLPAGDAHLSFGPQHLINCKVQIIYSKQCKKPHLHNHIRFQFTQLSEIDSLFLDHYIRQHQTALIFDVA